MPQYSINKLIIADDHPLFREALQQAVLSNLGDLQLVKCDTFSSLQRATVEHSDVDLVLLDLHMPGAVGFSALHYLGISHPHLPVIIVSANENQAIINKALKLGASGFIPKSTSTQTMLEAITAVIAGNVWAPTQTEQNNLNFDNHDADFAGRLEQLTPKQFRVLMMLVEGKTNQQMAEETFVTIATIKAHLSEIFKKLEVSNRTQAAMKAAAYLEIEDPSTISL